MKNLLLTGTIDPSRYGNTNVVVTDIEDRLKQYENAIIFYIEKTAFDKIIFVENSGYSFPEEKYKKLAEKNGKEFELIQVQTDKEKTKTKGKSYGEASCIEAGLEYSKLLYKEKSFYKITGRVILKNANTIICNNDDKTRLIFRHDLKKCYTVFFKANIQEYKKYFWGVGEICKEPEIDIETVFYRVVKDNKLNVKSFNSYPLLYGVIGTTGDTYQDNIVVYICKTLLAKVGMYGCYSNSLILNFLAKIRLFFFKKHKY